MAWLLSTFHSISLVAITVWLRTTVNAYTPVGRFGHSAVVVNNSIYFYGGDSSITSLTSTPLWISDLAILPTDIPFSLTAPAWLSPSGPQNSLGGPVVYSHVAFVGGKSGYDMILVGGVMPATEKNISNDDVSIVYSYDCVSGKWSTFNLPSNNYLDRQGAGSSVSSDGIAYIWGGKRTNTNTTGARQPLPSNMYRLDSHYPNNSTLIPTTSPTPPLRYAHTQTLTGDRFIVLLGGFDSLSGEAVSLADVWIFDLLYSQWRRVNAKLDNDSKPANRSSHSQVLMPDGVSILIYGGYDGYHVFNDVAVLDTRSWTWTIKNTNAAVQGRAEHTATLIGNNMVVAFGFTGVSTALTVMSDIEILDTATWSWSSMYIPSPGYGSKGTPENGSGSTDTGTSHYPATPSMAIVAGAVTGVLVVFVLIIIALYMFNYHKQRQKRHAQQFLHDTRRTGTRREQHLVPFEDLIKETWVQEQPRPLRRDQTQLRVQPLDPAMLLFARPRARQSYPPANLDWSVQRAATFAFYTSSRISKPDEPFHVQVRRAATTPAASSSTHVKENNNDDNNDDDDDDALFDQQEFVLRTDIPSLDEHMTEVEEVDERNANTPSESSSVTPSITPSQAVYQPKPTTFPFKMINRCTRSLENVTDTASKRHLLFRPTSFANST